MQHDAESAALLGEDRAAPLPRYRHTVSPLRWLALVIFVVLSSLQNLVWIAFSAVLKEAKSYYDIEDAAVTRLIEVSSFVFIPMCFVIGPMSDRFGLRCILLVGAGLVTAGGLCRWLGGRSYAYLFGGQVLNGMAGPVISNVPPQLAAAWFPIEQRATATAIAWAAQSVGVALGYLLAPRLAPTAGDIPRLMRWLAWASFGTLALCCVTPATPRLAPSTSAGVEKMGILQGGKALAKNRGYILLLLSWSTMYGVCVALSSLLDVFFSGEKGHNRHSFSDTTIGWAGFVGNGVGIVGNIIVPAYVDARGLQRHLKTFIFGLLLATCALCASFTVVACFIPGRLSIWAVSWPYIALSLTYGAVSPLVFELAAELSFPVAEETAAAYLNIIFMVSKTWHCMNHSDTLHSDVCNALTCCTAGYQHGLARSWHAHKHCHNIGSFDWGACSECYGAASDPACGWPHRARQSSNNAKFKC